MSEKKGFNFERDLPHQIRGVESVLHVFTNAISKHQDKRLEDLVNPLVYLPKQEFINNVTNIQLANDIDSVSESYHDYESNILDISMETGTGKTYTYTQTIFELNKALNLFKFIIVVPTRSIRAGTMSFLNSDACKDHFKQLYGKEIEPFVLEPKRASNKNKKIFMPQAIADFVRAPKTRDKIYVLIINSGMLNSSTMEESYDINIIDQFSSPFEALTAIHPLTIIDEPHKFKFTNKTWQNIEKLNSQYIIRYGATFDNQYQNLLYELTAVDAFNQDLVKGITTHVEAFSEGENIAVRLNSSTTNEATFELNQSGRKKTVSIQKDDSLAIIHPEMSNLFIERLNTRRVVLSNGLELVRGSVINPYSFNESLQDRMLQSAIKNHFELERELLTREVRIKPLTLFFIDDISSYRSDDEKNRSLKNKVELLILNEAKQLLKQETNEFYRKYLQLTIDNIEETHGGYFSKDNTDDDEKVIEEVEEILHDKERLLSLENIRRFIFSKWTLKEGWDNPNVFQICKLRSSGSETSKLQEVGRGLRLPVNEFMSRVKDESFSLNYYVDFTEKDFVKKLLNEINEKSNFMTGELITKVDDSLVERIQKAYPNLFNDSDEVYKYLDDQNIITRSNFFKDSGLEKLRAQFPSVFEIGVKKNKIRDGKQTILKTSIRSGKYQELQSLWEKLNEKVILEYKFKDEDEVKSLLKIFFLGLKDKFRTEGVRTIVSRIKTQGNQIVHEEFTAIREDMMPLSVMPYSVFLLELAQQLKVNKTTLHKVFIEIYDEININDYLSEQTIRTLQASFSSFLLENAFSKFEVNHHTVSSSIHPTALTNANGELKSEINASLVGQHQENGSAPTAYLFDEIFFDSNIEKDNILTHIAEVIVYTKIPKNSIRIPVAGGATYSPDFAYVIKTQDGHEQLNLIIESKGMHEDALRDIERHKIKHAKFFANKIWLKDLKIHFKTQFEVDKITDIISKCLND